MLPETCRVQLYIVRRLLALIPTLFFASLIVFVTVRLIPGNVIDLMLSRNDIAVGKDRAQLEAALGLDRPMLVQYLRWIGGLVALGAELQRRAPRGRRPAGPDLRADLDRSGDEEEDGLLSGGVSPAGASGRGRRAGNRRTG
jgi:binding-protein-dependent transport system inner membrane component